MLLSQGGPRLGLQMTFFSLSPHMAFAVCTLILFVSSCFPRGNSPIDSSHTLINFLYLWCWFEVCSLSGNVIQMYYVHSFSDFLVWLSHEPTCQCRRCVFDPWIGHFPREEINSPSILVWEIPRKEKLVGYGPWGSSKRVGHGLLTNQ